MKRTALFAGSFDPFTVGHLYVVQKALESYDYLVLSMAYNPEKPNRRFDINLMKTAIEQVFDDEGLSNRTKVIITTGLTFRAAKNEGASILVRGLRSGLDFEQEKSLARANKIHGGLETTYFLSDVEHEHISSTLVMQLLNNGENISNYVPKAILDAISKTS